MKRIALLLLAVCVHATAPAQITIHPVGAIGGTVYASALHGNTMFVTRSNAVVAIDLTNNALAELGTVMTSDFVYSLAMSGNYLYAGTTRHLLVIDATTPASMVVVKDIAPSGAYTPLALEIQGSRLYAAINYGSDPWSPYAGAVEIYSIANAANPSLLGTFKNGTNTVHSCLALANDKLAVLCAPTNDPANTDVIAVDVADPAHAVKTGTAVNVPYAWRIAADAAGTGLFCGYSPLNSSIGTKIYAVDASNVSAMSKKGEFTLSGNSVAMTRIGSTLFCTAAEKIVALDISNPSSMTKLGDIIASDSRGNNPVWLASTGSTLLAVTDGNLWQAYNASTTPALTVLDSVAAPSGVAYCAADGSYMYINDGAAEFLYDFSSGAGVLKRYAVAFPHAIPVTGPPRLRGTSLYCAGPGNISRYKIAETAAADPSLTGYIGLPSGDGSLPLIDVRGGTVYAASYSTNKLYTRRDPVTFDINATMDGSLTLDGKPFDMAVSEDGKYCYVTVEKPTNPGFEIVDGSNTSSPVVKLTAPTRYKLPSSLALQGTYLFVASQDADDPGKPYAVEQFDVSNPLSPVKTAEYVSHADAPVTGMAVKDSMVVVAHATGVQTIYPVAVSGARRIDAGDATQSAPTMAAGPKLAIGPSVGITPAVAGNAIVGATTSSYYDYKTRTVSSSPPYKFTQKKLLKYTPDSARTGGPPDTLPTLTFAAGGSQQQTCPPDDPGEEFDIVHGTVCADLVDGWQVSALKFECSGTGNEQTQVRKAIMYVDGVKTDEQAILADDASITMRIGKTLKPGQCLVWHLKYTFDTTNLKCGFDVLQTFQSRTLTAWLIAQPLTYVTSEMTPQSQFHSDGVAFGCVQNQRNMALYPSIQSAVNDAGTGDGDTLLACPGTYHEAVRLSKNLELTSRAGMDETVIDGTGLPHAWGVVVADGKSCTVQGFTIRNFQQDGIHSFSTNMLTLQNIRVTDNAGWGVIADGELRINARDGDLPLAGRAEFLRNGLGGVFTAANAGLTASHIVASHNGGPGIAARFDILLFGVHADYNAGPGIESALSGIEIHPETQSFLDTVSVSHNLGDGIRQHSGPGGSSDAARKQQGEDHTLSVPVVRRTLSKTDGGVRIASSAQIDSNLGWGIAAGGEVELNAYITIGAGDKRWSSVSGNGKSQFYNSLDWWNDVPRVRTHLLKPGDGGGLFSRHYGVTCYLATVSGNGGPGIAAWRDIRCVIGKYDDNFGPGIHSQTGAVEIIPVVQESDTVSVSRNRGEGIHGYMSSDVNSEGSGYGQAVSVATSIQIQNNSGWGIRAAGSVEIDRYNSTSGADFRYSNITDNGFDSTRVFLEGWSPDDEYGMDIVVHRNERGAGGGVISERGAVEGNFVNASHNGGAGIAAHDDVFLISPHCNDNQGPGVYAFMGDVEIHQQAQSAYTSECSRNVGYGIFGGREVDAYTSITADDNANEGLHGRDGIQINTNGGVPTSDGRTSSISRNGKKDSCWQYGDFSFDHIVFEKAKVYASSGAGGVFSERGGILMNLGRVASNAGNGVMAKKDIWLRGVLAEKNERNGIRTGGSLTAYGSSVKDNGAFGAVAKSVGSVFDLVASGNKYAGIQIDGNLLGAAKHVDPVITSVAPGTIESSTLSTNSGGGLHFTNGATGSVGNCAFLANTGDGMLNDSTAVRIDARNNWWGAASGPGGAGSGTGDKVSSGVDFAPWLSAAPAPAMRFGFDTLYVLPGDTVDLWLFLADPAHTHTTYSVAAHEQKSYLQRPTANGTFNDTMNLALLPAIIPASETVSATNRIVADATAGSAAMHDTMYIVVYAPRSTVASIAPDSMHIPIGSRLRFRATLRDQHGRPMSGTPVWQATGGTIDTGGVYTAGAAEGAVTVTAVGGNNQATATVFIERSHTVVLTTTHDTLRVDPGARFTVTALSVDQFSTFTVPNVQWETGVVTLDSAKVVAGVDSFDLTPMAIAYCTAPASIGTYPVIVKEAASGLADTEIILVAEPPSGVSQHASLAPGRPFIESVYPNPATDRVTVRIADAAARGVEIDVFTMLGQVIPNAGNDAMRRGSSIEAERVLSFAALPPGAYVLRVTAPGRVESQIVRVVR